MGMKVKKKERKEGVIRTIFKSIMSYKITDLIELSHWIALNYSIELLSKIMISNYFIKSWYIIMVLNYGVTCLGELISTPSSCRSMTTLPTPALALGTLSLL